MRPTNHTPHVPLFLPLPTHSSLGVRRESNDEEISARGKRTRVLLIDDTRRFRKGLSFMLTQKYKAEVSDVGSGQEGIKEVRTGPKFDLIFVDVRMAPMDGFETCEALREIDPVASIVLMSAYADDTDLDRAKKLGLELIDKPVQEETIARIMSGCRRTEP